MPTSLVSTGVQFPDSTIQTTAASAGGSVTATATGSISNGAPVVLNANGSVSIVTDTTGAVTVLSSNAGDWVEASNTGSTNAAIDPSTNKIMVVFTNGTTGYSSCKIGTCNFTNNTITWGSEIPINSNFYSGTSQDVTWDISASRFVIVVRNGSTSGVVAVPTISGTSVSAWSSATFQSNYVNQLKIVYCPSESCSIVCYTIESGAAYYSAACVIRVSGGAPVPGSPANFSGTTSYVQSPDLAWDNNAQRIVIAYRNNTSFAMRAVVGTVSGSSLSFGSEVVVTTYNSAPNYMVYDVPSTKIVMGYPTNTSNSVYSICTVSGSTISIGTATNFLSAGGLIQVRSYSRVSGSSFVLATLATTGANMIFYSASVFGSALSISSAVDGAPASGNNMNFTAYSTSSKRYVQGYQYQQTGQTGRTMVLSQTNLGSTFLGFSTASYTNGQTATISAISSINTSQTGLTAGSAYYVLPAGTLSTTSSSGAVYAGLSLNTTSLLVKG